MNMGPFTSIFVMQSLFTNLLTSPHHVSTSRDGTPQVLLTNHRRSGGPYVTYNLDSSTPPTSNESIILQLLNASDAGPYPPQKPGDGSVPDVPTESSVRPRRESKDDTGTGAASIWNNILNYFRKPRSSEDNEIQSENIVPLDANTSLSKKGKSDGQNGDTMKYNTNDHNSARKSDHVTAWINGLRIEGIDKGVTYDGGISSILANDETAIRLFGHKFSNRTIIRFTTESRARGEHCKDAKSTSAYALRSFEQNEYFGTAMIEVIFPPSQHEENYYLCVKENNTEMAWVHQGSESWLTITAYERLLPFWVQCIFICCLLLISGLFAGLTLGLLALDQTDLRILANTGTEKERSYAKTIIPLRTRGNLLLCSLVFGNVLVNSTLTILLDDLTSGLIAIICSTAGIVIFGEIIPQAVCSRHGLAIGAKTVWITKTLMFITFPLSFVISLLLDKILGEEIGIVYNREKLKELITITIAHNDLETDEVNIISGALSMKKKCVADIMTRIEDVFMLPIETVLDFEVLNEIRKQGYSRIPIYDGERSHIVSLLYTKDLVFVDCNDKVMLKTLVEFYNNQCFFVFADSKLDSVFSTFKSGNHGHLAFVQRINTAQDDKDPFCETIGLVTLEDVIEELIQSEIVDETDVWVDNRSKKRITTKKKQDFSQFAEIRNCQKTICISPQLALATFQFLSTVVEPFKSTYVSDTVLHRLLKKNILLRIKKAKEQRSHMFIYECGKPSDIFTVVLEGRVEVCTGKENLTFQTGIFSYFGVPALTAGADFIPDYTVTPVLDSDVILMRVKRTLYLACLEATALENEKMNNLNMKDSVESDVNNLNASIDEQIEHVLRNVDSETQVGISLTVQQHPSVSLIVSDEQRKQEFRTTTSLNNLRRFSFSNNRSESPASSLKSHPLEQNNVNNV